MAILKKGGKAEGMLLGAFMGIFLFGLVFPLALGLCFLLLNGVLTLFGIDWLVVWLSNESIKEIIGYWLWLVVGGALVGAWFFYKFLEDEIAKI
ncbi:MAG: hypothetical protein Q8O83_01980 [bacterium]|nr:hypothetical protein [bacterium]